MDVIMANESEMWKMTGSTSRHRPSIKFSKTQDNHIKYARFE